MRMLGEERMLTGPEAGITRDAISSDWNWKGRGIKLWDTAGIRRKSRVQEKMEKLSVADALRAIRFAECVVVLIDADHADRKTGPDTLRSGGPRRPCRRSCAFEMGCGGRQGRSTLRELTSKLQDVLPEMPGVPLVTLSAMQGRGIDRLMKAVLDADAAGTSASPLSKLNRWLEDAMERNAPPAPLGPAHQDPLLHPGQCTAADLCHLRQPADELPESYLRYLMQRPSRRLRLDGTPIRFILARRQESLRRRRRFGRLTDA